MNFTAFHGENKEKAEIHSFNSALRAKYGLKSCIPAESVINCYQSMQILSGRLFFLTSILYEINISIILRAHTKVGSICGWSRLWSGTRSRSSFLLGGMKDVETR